MAEDGWWKQIRSYRQPEPETYTPRPELLNSEFPKALEAHRVGLITTYQAISVVGALLSTMQAALILVVKDKDINESYHHESYASMHAWFKTILIFTYISFTCGIGAIVSSLVMIDALGKLPYLNCMSNAEFTADQSMPDLLGDMGLRPLHALISFYVSSLATACIYVGVASTLLQLILWVWLHEAATPCALATLFGILPLLPLVGLCYQPYPSGTPRLEALPQRNVPPVTSLTTAKGV